MAGGDEPANGGRVTTQQFYEALLKVKDELRQSEERQSKERDATEARLSDEIAGIKDGIKDELACLKDIPALVTVNAKEIDTLRKKSDIWNSLNSLGVMVGTAFSSLWNNGG